MQEEENEESENNEDEEDSPFAYDENNIEDEFSERSRRRYNANSMVSENMDEDGIPEIP